MNVPTAVGVCLVLTSMTAARAHDLRGQQREPPPGPPPRASWVSDRVALREGDIVTILVDELTLATANRDENSAQARSRDLSLRAGSGGGSGGSLRTGNDVSHTTRGTSSRRERFSAEISARVVEILPSGVARIEGVKKLRIDKHEQEVTVRGFIRPQDLSPTNTVESWRVAGAEILYASNGELGKTGGIWTKLLNLLIP